MFTFFSKNKFLVDYLEGFIDIHNHILPSIDDGAKNVEESVEILKGFSEIGITNFVATPHIMQDFHPNNPNTITKALETLQIKLDQLNMRNIVIEAAAEHMIDSNFESILDKGEVVPLKERYLLVEMSYLQPSINFKVSIEKIKSKGYFPILAHPERYQFLWGHRNKYKKYREMGILFQMNLLSLGNYYGPEVKKNAMYQLDNGQIHFMGSDIHNLQHIQALKEIKISNKAVSKVLAILENSIQEFR